MREIKYAFLNLKGHYRGDSMLKNLITHGFVPVLVIEEASLLAAKSRRTLLKDLELTEGISMDYAALGIDHLTVSNHNDPDVESMLKAHNIELIILGDCRIIKRTIFDIPRYGAINVHPGYLPTVRGNTPYIWALVDHLPQGCTAHFIDDGIDTGDIILRRNIDMADIHSYKQLLVTINECCVGIILAVMQDFCKTVHLQSTRQQDMLQQGDRVYYYTLAPPAVKAKAVNYWSSRN